jgi:hypothetical protein
VGISPVRSSGSDVALVITILAGFASVSTSAFVLGMLYLGAF